MLLYRNLFLATCGSTLKVYRHSIRPYKTCNEAFFAVFNLECWPLALAQPPRWPWHRPSPRWAWTPRAVVISWTIWSTWYVSGLSRPSRPPGTRAVLKCAKCKRSPSRDSC